MAKTILIVDDSPAKRDILNAFLAPAGYTMLEANDGEEGLEMIRALHPDLVIVDLIMPGMDGYEFVRQLHREPAIAQTPVVFYSATYAYDKILKLALDCGVGFVIPLSAGDTEVQSIVDAALTRHVPPIFDEPKTPAEELQDLVEELKVLAERKHNVS